MSGPGNTSEVYKSACERYGVKPNSTLLKKLAEPDGVFGEFDVPLSSGVLDMRRNYVGNRGVLAVLEVVRALPALTELNLHDNGLRNDAAVAISQVCGDHPGLRRIDVSQNQISFNGGKALLDMLKRNPRITDLDYSNNRIDVDVRLKLKAAVAENADRKD